MPEYLINHNRTIAIRICGNIETLCEYDHIPLKEVPFIESKITERRVGEKDIIERRGRLLPATLEDYEEVMHKAIAWACAQLPDTLIPNGTLEITIKP